MDMVGRVEYLAESLQRLLQFRGKTIVVKLGGSAMDQESPLESFLKDLILLQKAGIFIVLIHGGGKSIDQAMIKSGLQPKKIAGRRVTDDETLKIVVDVLLNETNNSLVNKIQSLGGKAIALHTERQALWGKKWLLETEAGLVDLGHVGTVEKIDHVKINNAILCGEIPVIPSLAINSEGKFLNINADTCACAVAAALKASSLVFLSDIPGILKDRENPKSLMKTLREHECMELVASKIIDMGMIPKVESCIESLKSGVGSTRLIDGRIHHSLLMEFSQAESIGTVITL